MCLAIGVGLLLSQLRVGNMAFLTNLLIAAGYYVLVAKGSARTIRQKKASI
jgi:hypothetical protein